MTVLQIKSARDFHQARTDEAKNAFDRISNFFKIKGKKLEKKEVFFLTYKYAIYKTLEGKKLGPNPIALGNIANYGSEELDTLAVAIFGLKPDMEIIQKGDECIKQAEMLAYAGALLLADEISEYPLSINFLEDLADEISKELK